MGRTSRLPTLLVTVVALTVLLTIQYSKILNEINVQPPISTNSIVSSINFNYKQLYCDEVFVRQYESSKISNEEQKQNNKRRIYNVFPYDGEQHLLLTRLYELQSIVDYFVIVESERSFNPEQIIYKSIKFRESDALFAQYHSQILHLIISDHSYSNQSNNNSLKLSFREWFRTRVIPEFLAQFPHYSPNANDLFLGTDLDELTSANALLPFRACDLSQYSIKWPILFELDWFVYDFGCEVRAKWARRPALTPFHSLLGNPNCAPSKQCHMYRHFRTKIESPIKHGTVSVSAGWHLSFFMSLQQMHSKLRHAGDRGKDRQANHDRMDCYVSKCYHIRKGIKTHLRNTDIREELSALCESGTNEMKVLKYPRLMVRESCKPINSTTFPNFFPNTQDYASFANGNQCNYTRTYPSNHRKYGNETRLHLGSTNPFKNSHFKSNSEKSKANLFRKNEHSHKKKTKKEKQSMFRKE